MRFAEFRKKISRESEFFGANYILSVFYVIVIQVGVHLKLYIVNSLHIHLSIVKILKTTLIFVCSKYNSLLHVSTDFE